MTLSAKKILFEYDIPVDAAHWINYSAGVWQLTFTGSVSTVDDDNGNTGYYTYLSTTKNMIRSVKYNDADLPPVDSVLEVESTWAGAFYYDPDTAIIYARFPDSEPELDAQIYVGASVGYTLRASATEDGFYYNDIYYEPRVTNIFDLKKSVDPLFYGLLKYPGGNVDFINNDGHFDDWRSRNLFGQRCRILWGDVGTAYEDLEILNQSNIENDKRTWDSFSIDIQDVRKALSQPVATNTLSATDWPYLDDSDVGYALPVAYGQIFNAESKCLNTGEPGAAFYTFLICDTTFHAATSLDEVRVNGVVKAAASTNLTEGTFTLASADCVDNLGDVRIDFHGADIENGVDIIKDLLEQYDGKPYLAAFFDLTEIDDARDNCRDTSVYVNEKSTKLSDVLQGVCVDIDARFFQKDSGIYTIRLYDPNRTPIKTIYTDEWLDNPEISNNGSEYLTSAIIGYHHDQDADKYYLYEDTSYQDTAFATYKKLKTERFDTNLTTLADAQAKAQTILNISSQVEDIIERTTTLEHFDLELGDFIIAAPEHRITGTEVWGIYEILSTNKSPGKMVVKLSMRYVTAYTPAVDTYYALIDENYNFIVDENGNTIIGGM